MLWLGEIGGLQGLWYGCLLLLSVGCAVVGGVGWRGVWMGAGGVCEWWGFRCAEVLLGLG